MILTQEEKIMYQVMKAIYESGIPISFKGSMVLKACLIEAGCLEHTRHTVDIDANWNSSTAPTAEQMTESLKNAIAKGGLNLDVSLSRMYGENRSAGFKLIDHASGETLFTMDIDVNKPIPPTKIYEVDGVRFCGVLPTQMIADKLAVISTEAIHRRIKDVVDMYYLSKTFVFDEDEVLQTLKSNGRTLGSFYEFLNSKSALREVYEKFRFTSDVDKPSFDKVYPTVKSYIKSVLPKERHKETER